MCTIIREQPVLIQGLLYCGKLSSRVIKYQFIRAQLQCKFIFLRALNFCCTYGIVQKVQVLPLELSYILINVHLFQRVREGRPNLDARFWCLPPIPARSDQ